MWYAFDLVEPSHELTNRDQIPYSVFVDSLVAEFNSNLQSMVESFILRRLVDELRTFEIPKYPEFSVDAAKIFKD